MPAILVATPMGWQNVARGAPNMGVPGVGVPYTYVATTMGVPEGAPNW